MLLFGFVNLVGKLYFVCELLSRVRLGVKWAEQCSGT